MKIQCWLTKSAIVEYELFNAEPELIEPKKRTPDSPDKHDYFVSDKATLYMKFTQSEINEHFPRYSKMNIREMTEVELSVKLNKAPHR